MKVKPIEDEYRRIVGEAFELPYYTSPDSFAKRFKPCTIFVETPIIVISSTKVTNE